MTTLLRGNISEERLTTELAVRAMLWRVAPGRYLKAGGGWVARSKFRPLVNVNHAFQALDAVTNDYSLLAKPGGGFKVNIRLHGRASTAAAESKALAICLALAEALGISQADDSAEACASPLLKEPKNGQ